MKEVLTKTRPVQAYVRIELHETCVQPSPVVFKYRSEPLQTKHKQK